MDREQILAIGHACLVGIVRETQRKGDFVMKRLVLVSKNTQQMILTLHHRGHDLVPYSREGHRKYIEIMQITVIKLLAYSGQIVFVVWLSWEPWHPCSVTCGKGTESRTRKCSTLKACRGSPRETRECVKESCPSKNIKPMY